MHARVPNIEERFLRARTRTTPVNENRGDILEFCGGVFVAICLFCLADPEDRDFGAHSRGFWARLSSDLIDSILEGISIISARVGL